MIARDVLLKRRRRGNSMRHPELMSNGGIP